jgi:hypothetical protein
MASSESVESEALARRARAAEMLIDESFIGN